MDMLEEIKHPSSVYECLDRIYMNREGDAYQRHDGASFFFFFKSADYSRI